MIAELFVEGKRLDMSADMSSLLTFAIDDIKDFSHRQTAWSKTIVLPGTANNNAIFGGIFETGLTNDYDPTLPNIAYNFNVSKSARCIVFQDNFQTFKGTLRMLEIDKDKGRIEYQVALNGELTSLSVALTNGLLTDLDFSAYDMAYTVANISDSWSNTPGSGVYFPMIDYGTYSVTGVVARPKRDWQFGTFRPALYVREYIDKIFSAASFRYDAPLFDTDRFKRLIIPHGQKDLLAPKTGLLFNANTIAEENVLHWGTGTVENDIHFPIASSGSFTTTDNKVFTYIGSTPVTGTLDLTFKGKVNIISVFGSAKLIVRINGSDYHTDPTPITGTTDVLFTRTYHLSITFSPGDYFSVHIIGTATGFGVKDLWSEADSTINYTTAATILAPAVYGETIQMKYALPQNVRQIDFLVSLVKLFNLYIYEDPFDERLMHIRPFVNFFEQGAGSVEDWTQKMDRNEMVKVKPMSEVNTKLYNFKYKSDSDYYNEIYQKRYNQGYGSFVFDTEFEFSSNTTDIEIIFAPTPLVGYQGEEKVYSTIFKKSSDTEDRTDSVIRILQTKNITGIDSWNIQNGTTVLGSYTSYGYAGHYDNPDNPSDDLNFGGLKEVFYELVAAAALDHTQFNLYWSLYMVETTDKDSKLLSARFYLTPRDIASLRFSQFKTVDGVLWRLNKITDYNASKPDTCQVELLRVINTNYRYPLGNTADSDNALLWNDTGALMANDTDELIWE